MKPEAADEGAIERALMEVVDAHPDALVANADRARIGASAGGGTLASEDF